ncbi:hypothetical protein ACQPW3_30590 [Actinosynnema sp. CA-248983]
MAETAAAEALGELSGVGVLGENVVVGATGESTGAEAPVRPIGSVAPIVAAVLLVAALPATGSGAADVVGGTKVWTVSGSVGSTDGSCARVGATSAAFAEVVDARCTVESVSASGRSTGGEGICGESTGIDSGTSATAESAARSACGLSTGDPAADAPVVGGTAVGGTAVGGTVADWAGVTGRVAGDRTAVVWTLRGALGGGAVAGLEASR